jgi:hypothetical protein
MTDGKITLGQPAMTFSQGTPPSPALKASRKTIKLPLPEVVAGVWRPAHHFGGKLGTLMPASGSSKPDLDISWIFR